MHVRSSQSSSPFLQGVGAGEDESWGRRVQPGQTPCAIKLNCLTLLPSFPSSKSKGLNCCQANEAELCGDMFRVLSAVVEQSKVRDSELHQWGQQNLTSCSKGRLSVLIYDLSGERKALSSYHS